MYRTVSISIFSLLVIAAPSLVTAQPKPKYPINNQISQEKLSGAMGHFSRARSLLSAAINEFDKGRVVYDPSALIDAIEWRAVVAQKAKELETLLAPKARESETGIKYDGDNRLLRDSDK